MVGCTVAAGALRSIKVVSQADVYVTAKELHLVASNEVFLLRKVLVVRRPAEWQKR